MNFSKATYEDLVSLKMGSPVIVNIKDKLNDVAIFMEYDRARGEIRVVDCFAKSKDGLQPNVFVYSECYIIPKEKEALLRLLQKKM